jgi:hypothetical protein
VVIALDFEEKNKMTLFKKIFKRKKRLEELDDCPDIKGCKFKASGILYSCENGDYTSCLIYRNKKEKEEEKCL